MNHRTTEQLQAINVLDNNFLKVLTKGFDNSTKIQLSRREQKCRLSCEHCMTE
jgi:hypothetical protein